jgi:hypothetical protein
MGATGVLCQCPKRNQKRGKHQTKGTYEFGRLFSGSFPRSLSPPRHPVRRARLGQPRGAERFLILRCVRSLVLHHTYTHVSARLLTPWSSVTPTCVSD